MERDGSSDDAWWQAGGPMMLIGLSLGVTVYGRLLTIAPTLRRNR